MEIPKSDAVCDGGDLDCGSGLLLIIRNAMQSLHPGGVLEVKSRESSVKEDLPAWCRMVGHSLLEARDGENRYTHYFIRKKQEDEAFSRDMEDARNYKWRLRARWTEGLKVKTFVRNHSFWIGQPASFDTEDEAPSAVEYLLASVAGCLAVGFQWRVSRRNLEVHDLEISLQAQADNILVFLGLENEGNPGLRTIEGKIYVNAEGEDEELEEIWRETLEKSPVTRTLIGQVAVNIEMRRT